MTEENTKWQYSPMWCVDKKIYIPVPKGTVNTRKFLSDEAYRTVPSKRINPLLADGVQKVLFGRLVRCHEEVDSGGELPYPLAVRDVG